MSAVLQLELVASGEIKVKEEDRWMDRRTRRDEQRQVAASSRGKSSGVPRSDRPDQEDRVLSARWNAGEASQPPARDAHCWA